MPPQMIVVAGPPGSGKSIAFPVSSFGVDFFNADDRAAEIHGSYQGISPEVRAQVNQEFESFVHEHIHDRVAFAVETTLRSGITFEQARAAQRAGFQVLMRYVALDDVEENLRRVKIRALEGGHSAPESVLRGIHQASLRNLLQALRDLDYVAVFDNSQFGKEPLLVMETKGGKVIWLAESLPLWLERALHGTQYEIGGQFQGEP